MHKLGALVLRYLLVVSLAIAGLGFAATPAAAYSPGVAFGAVNLPTWQTNDVVYAVEQARGMVFAGGSFTQVRPPTGGSGTAQNRAGLAVFNAATGAPASCQFTMGGTARVRSILASPDGSTVYIAGEYSTVNGTSRARITALDVVNCSVRTGFNAGIVNAEVYGLGLSGNVLYLAGGFTSVRDQTRQYFAAVNATTGALLPWTADGQSYPDAPPAKRGRAITPSPDGTRVALGGYFYYINGTFTHSIAIVSAADQATGEGGNLLRTYPQGFIPGNPNATSTTTEAPSGTSATHVIVNGHGDGRFYIGNEGIGGGVFDGRAAFSWATGDQIWRDTCLGATQGLVEHQGTLYSASHAHDCSGSSAFAFQDGKRNYFMAQDAATSQHFGWDPKSNDGTGEGIGPRSLVVATGNDGKLYLWGGGEFTQMNGAAQQGLTRFGTESNAAPSSPAIAAEGTSDGKIQVRLRASVDADDSELTYNLLRGSSTTPIATATASSVWWKRPQVTLVDPSPVANQLNTYRVSVTDGTTTVTTGTVGARSTAVSNDYTSVIRSDSPTLLWSGARSGIFLYDTGASNTAGNRLGGRMEMGVADSTDSPLPGDTASLLFDGTDDYVWNDQYAPGPATYSIETWIKTTTTRGGKIVGYGNGRPHTGSSATRLSSSYDRHVYMTNNGRLVFGAYNNAAIAITSASSYNDGNWHHVVATQGAGGMALYVDGARVGTNANTGAQNYWGVWHVGGDQLNSWPNRPSSNFFAGQIDETAVYGSALSRQAVIRHYEASGRSYASNPVPADAYGAAVYNADPDFYWRLDELSGNTARDSSYFGEGPGTYGNQVGRGIEGLVPGNAAIQTSGTSNGTVARTVAASPSPVFSGQVWFRTGTTSGGKIFGFENTATGNGSAYDKHLYMANDGRLVFGTYTGSVQTVVSPGSYNNNVWHQAVGVLDGTGTKLYVDGVLVASSGVTGAETGTGYWRLGGGNLSGWTLQPSSNYFSGQLDEFSMFSRALTGAEISQLYGLGVADQTAPSVPAGLATTVDGSTVNLSWSASTDNYGVASYDLYRGDTVDFEANASSRIATVSGTTHADTDRAAGTWYYRVSATDGAGNASAASAAVEAVVPDVAAPLTPAGLTATVNSGSVQLSWNATTDNVGVTGYSVYRGTTPDFTADDDSKLTDVAGTTYADPSAAVGDQYYRVAAFDAAGNVSPASAAVLATVPDIVLPSVPTDVGATVAGTTVSLAWSASSDNVGVTGYSVYRGTTSGFTPAAGNKLADVSGTAYEAVDQPAGTQYYKVIAFDAAGNRSAASDPASAVVPDQVAPSAPTGLDVTVGANSVTLTWAAATDNVAVTGYSVYRGTTADFTADAGSKLADVTNRSYLDQPLAPGDYFYKVVATDAAGNVSDPSAARQATVAAPDTTAPTAPTGLAAGVSSSTVNLTWTAATDNVGVTGYSVYRGTSAGFTPAAGNKVGDPTATSFSESSVPVGTWYYKVTAQDAAGNTSDPSAAAEATVSAPPADPVTIRVNVAQDARVQSANPTTNYGSDTQLADRGSPDQQSFLDFALPAAPSGTVLNAAVLELRTSGDTAAGSAATHRVDLMSGSWSESTLTWNSRPTTQTALLANMSTPTTNHTSFTASLSVAGLTPRLGSTVALRISTTSTDNLRLWSREVGTVSYRPVLRLEFVPGSGSGDTAAPSVPGGLDADVSSTTVNLSWNASTDNVGVENYEVYRGTSSGFTANAASRIATVEGLSHADSGLAPDTYYYKVRAFDAAGNASDATAAVSATVEAPAPDPVTVAVSTTVDAGTASTAPGTNYGSDTQLFARGNTAQESFLSFDVPNAPAGMQLTGAVLSYRTSGDPAAGSADTFPVQLVTGAWTESTITWSNRPTTAAGNLGTISGASANNTPYTTNLSAATLDDHLGETVTVRISGSGSDNLRLWSGEATAAYRPTITFTFEAS